MASNAKKPLVYTGIIFISLYYKIIVYFAFKMMFKINCLSISEPIKFIIGMLEKATKSSTHDYLGFSTSDIADGISKLAVNESNSKQVRLLCFECMKIIQIGQNNYCENVLFPPMWVIW